MLAESNSAIILLRDTRVTQQSLSWRLYGKIQIYQTGNIVYSDLKVAWRGARKFSAWGPIVWVAKELFDCHRSLDRRRRINLSQRPEWSSLQELVRSQKSCVPVFIAIYVNLVPRAPFLTFGPRKENSPGNEWRRYGDPSSFAHSVNSELPFPGGPLCTDYLLLRGPSPGLSTGTEGGWFSFGSSFFPAGEGSCLVWETTLLDHRDIPTGCGRIFGHRCIALDQRFIVPFYLFSMPNFDICCGCSYFPQGKG